MMTQSDLFGSINDSSELGQIAPEPSPTPPSAAPIAVPCGFLDRANKPCQRLGSWPVMMAGKQMVCRGRPMVHCDPACFSSVQAPSRGYQDDNDILWEDRDQSYGEAA